MRGNAAFAINVYIDAQALKGKVPKSQKSLLREIRDACNGMKEKRATVYACNGRRGKGHYHFKSTVVDRRLVYAGGANCTEQSEWYNEESCFKLAGPTVTQVLERFMEHRQKGKVWDGS